jgi:hypothetical protein
MSLTFINPSSAGIVSSSGTDIGFGVTRGPLVLASALAVCFMDPASAATKRSTGSQNAIRIEALIPPLPLVRACRTAAAVRKFRRSTERISALEVYLLAVTAVTARRTTAS